MTLKDVLRGAARSMRLQFETFSAQWKHRGLRGTARESVVLDFLERYLPASVELSKGEIIDTAGNTSNECDIIAFDRMKMPLLMGDAHQRIVFSEAAYAVVEVKTRLDSEAVGDCVRKCAGIKRLIKTAYCPEPGPITRFISVYGEQMPHFPTLFTVFAFESIDPSLVAKALGEGYKAYTMSGPQMVDGILCIDEYVLAWHHEEAGQYDLVWTPGAKPKIFTLGEDSLMFWYFLFFRWMSQAWCWPIRIQGYGPDRMGPSAEG